MAFLWLSSVCPRIPWEKTRKSRPWSNFTCFLLNYASVIWVWEDQRHSVDRIAWMWLLTTEPCVGPLHLKTGATDIRSAYLYRCSCKRLYLPRSPYDASVRRSVAWLSDWFICSFGFFRRSFEAVFFRFSICFSNSFRPIFRTNVWRKFPLEPF